LTSNNSFDIVPGMSLEGIRVAVKEATKADRLRQREIAEMHRLASSVLERQGSRRLNARFWLGLSVLPLELVVAPIDWMIDRLNPVDSHTKRVFTSEIKDYGEMIPVVISSKHSNLSRSSISIDVRKEAYKLNLYPGVQPSAEIVITIPENPYERGFWGTSLHTRPASLEELTAFRPLLESLNGHSP